MNKIIKRSIHLSLFGLLVATTACSQSESESETESTDSATSAAPATSNSAQGEAMIKIATAQSTDQQVTDAIDDLLIRTSVAKDDVVVVSARDVTWGSGALGCPEQDKNYTDQLVPGLQLLLQIGKTTYYYHGRKGMPLVYCPADRVQAPTMGMGTEVM
jgi:hypothetical protein